MFGMLLVLSSGKTSLEEVFAFCQIHQYAQGTGRHLLKVLYRFLIKLDLCSCCQTPWFLFLTSWLSLLDFSFCVFRLQNCSSPLIKQPAKFPAIFFCTTPLILLFVFKSQRILIVNVFVYDNDRSLPYRFLWCAQLLYKNIAAAPSLQPLKFTFDVVCYRSHAYQMVVKIKVVVYH